jgi:hydroxyacylglutathione hydrolase
VGRGAPDLAASRETDSVILEQYYLDCLSHASYLVGDEGTGRAVVVDPQRDVDQYLDDAAARGLTIERVIETHVHADFLSGHLELAARTGAVISYGAAVTGIGFAYEPLADGTRLSLGDVTLEIRATPGHTPESISVVVYEHADDTAPYGVLTGDTLFIGDVGRPDLLASVGITADELARKLYHSVHERLLTLPDGTRVFPAHGAGSACGKQLSTERQSTIGEQRTGNYALRPMTEDEFVDVVTEGQPTQPGYFSFDAQRNREDRPVLDEHRPPAPMSLDEVRAAVDGGAIVVDTRDAADFASGHLAGAINVGLGGRFAEWAGDVLRPDTDVVLVTNPGHELEAKVRLARIGFDRVLGFLADGTAALAAHPELTARSSRLSVAELNERRESVAGLQIVDVRSPGEIALGTIEGARELPLASLPTRVAELDPSAPTVVFCASGPRASTAASVLERAGFRDVSQLLGGYDAWRADASGSARLPG